MGGGDLNLKKTWNPNTMKNHEMVRRAEQAKSQEDNKKRNDLRKEIEEEKHRENLKRIGRGSRGLADGNVDKKLDWMYKNSTKLINRDEYLLGRKIDKSFESLQAEEKVQEHQNFVGLKQPLNHVEHDCVPFSIRSYKNFENCEQVDLQRKVMEDPLMLIKQQEMESRKKILENPVKLKELHRILKTDEKLRKATKKSKNKKSQKKHKKSKRTSSPSRSSESDLDSKLAKKLQGDLLSGDETSSFGGNLAKLLGSKFEKISQELDKAAEKGGQSKKHHAVKRKTDSGLSGGQSIIFSYQKYENRTKNHREEKNRRRTRDFRRQSKSRSTEKERVNLVRQNYSQSGFRDGNVIKRSTSSIAKCDIDDLKKISRTTSRDRKMRYRKMSKSPVESNRSPDRYQKIEKPKSNTVSSKLTNEERQVKLEEMVSNAVWRETERNKVVREHREVSAKEEHHSKINFDRNFLNNQVKEAMSNQTSLGGRLRANLNNIQRASSTMNINFVRKHIKE